MLTPPLSESDVGKKFRTRDGGTATLIRKRAEGAGGWWLRFATGETDWVYRDGKRYSGHDSPYDLISRIEEQEMESQVVIEDKREEPELKKFEYLESGSIVSRGTSGELYLVAGNERALQLTGADAGKFINASPHVSCRLLPHLRLRMILEEK